MAMLYLVRHGTSIEQSMIRGRLTGFPLNEKGKRQAAALADFFADRDVTAIYSSPLQRTYETAQAIAREKKLNVKMSEQLNEWYAPLWQGKYWSQIKRLQVLQYALAPTRLNLNGEKLEEVAERMAAFLRTVSTRGTDIVCVSHRDCIIAGKLKLMGKSLNRLNINQCHTGSVTILDVTEEKTRELGYFEP